MSTYSSARRKQDKKPREPSDSPAERSDLLRSRFERIRRVVFRYWWILAVTTSAGLLYQGWLAFNKPVTYESHARIIVSGKVRIPEGASFNEEAVNFFGTQLELMRSAEVRQRAAARVRSARPDLSPAPVSLSVTQIPLTSIFQLSASSTSPDYLRAYLNAVMEEYISLRRGMFSEKSQTTLSAIRTELNNTERDLLNSEEELFSWKQANNLVFLQEEGNNSGSYLSSLNRQLALLESEFSLLNKLSEEQNLARVANPLSGEFQTPSGAMDESLSAADSSLVLNQGSGAAEVYQQIRRHLFLQESRLQQMLETRRENHPLVQKLREEIEQNQRLLQAHRQQALEQIDFKKQSLRAQIENVQEQISKWEAKSLDLSKRIGEYERLRSRVDRQKALYERLLFNIQSIDLNVNIDQDILSIYEHASSPTVRLHTIVRDLLTGAFFGLLLGSGILFLIASFDDRICTLTELQDSLTEEVVGLVPEVPQTQIIIQDQEEDNPRLLESFRKIRSWLYCTTWANGLPKSLLITSSIPGEGKSTVAVNLAITLAAGGAKVLLVDADLRRGRLHKFFEVDYDPGLGNILNGEKSAAQVIIPSGRENLWLLPRGHYGTKGSDYFLQSSLDHFLTEVESDYDMVVFDSSPVLAADETSVLSSKLDSVLFLVRSGFTSMRLAKRTMELLHSRNAAVDGVIYNAVDPSAADYPYYNYYSQGPVPPEVGVKSSSHST
jgi:succinoglycan biosynthesis transport protein ExoP